MKFQLNNIEHIIDDMFSDLLKINRIVGTIKDEDVTNETIGKLGEIEEIIERLIEKVR